MNEEFPVTAMVERNGRTEEVHIGSAVRSGSGFTLRLVELHINTGAAVEAQARRAAPIASSPGGGMAFPNYGRSKGQPVAGATMGDLEYYASGARRSLADPAKARFHDKERVLLAAIEAEITRQQGMPPMDPVPGGFDDGRPPPDEYGGPPPPDEDIPF